MQGIFRKENTDKALKYGIYRHLPTYEKIIRNLVSFYEKKMSQYGFYIRIGSPLHVMDHFLLPDDSLNAFQRQKIFFG